MCVDVFIALLAYANTLFYQRDDIGSFPFRFYAHNKTQSFQLIVVKFLDNEKIINLFKRDNAFDEHHRGTGVCILLSNHRKY